MESPFDAANLKVNDLRDELKRRNLNPIGTKAILTQRLQQALSADGYSLQDFARSLSEAVKLPVEQKENQFAEKEELKKVEPVTKTTPMEQQATKESKVEPPVSKKQSSSPNRSNQQEYGRDRNRSPPKTLRPVIYSQDEEVPGWEKSENVFLDSYNCDLTLSIDKSGYNAKPMTQNGFSLMWAGVRSTYGIRQGKCFFEVRLTKELPVENTEELAGGVTHVLRVGWSSEKSGFALGEESLSYGYGGTGKKSCDNKFLDYGCTFGEGDTIGCFIEYLHSDIIISYSVNGAYQGECFRIPMSSFGGDCALFPHIYVKNVEFSVNFGQNHQPAWFPPTFKDPGSWKLMNEITVNARVHGRLPPPSKSECEVIMMIGLPGCGKTVFTDKFCKEHSDRQYNVLGTNLILDKMKVTGLSRKRNYTGRWDLLIEKATQCLNNLISFACKRRRNYILDQTNVYPSAQRRKMRPFEGFQRKAIVIVPSDEEFRRRIAQREKEEGKEVPESAVLEMKANFEIPKTIDVDSSSVFDQVIFTELQRNDAEILVKQYNSEGRSNRPPPEKRQRMDQSRDRGRESRFSDRDRGDRHDTFNRSPNSRDNRERRDTRGGGFGNSRDRSDDRSRFDRGPSGRDRGEQFGRGGRFGPSAPDGRFEKGPFPSRDRQSAPQSYPPYQSNPPTFTARGGPPTRGGPRGSYAQPFTAPYGEGNYRGGRGNATGSSDSRGGYRTGPPRAENIQKPEEYPSYGQPKSEYISNESFNAPSIDPAQKSSVFPRGGRGAGSARGTGSVRGSSTYDGNSYTVSSVRGGSTYDNGSTRGTVPAYGSSNRGIGSTYDGASIRGTASSYDNISARGSSAVRGGGIRAGASESPTNKNSNSFKGQDSSEGFHARGSSSQSRGMSRGASIGSARQDPYQLPASDTQPSYSTDYDSYGRPSAYPSTYGAHGGEDSNYNQMMRPPTESTRQDTFEAQNRSSSRFSTAPPTVAPESYSSYETYGVKTEVESPGGYRGDFRSRGTRGSLSQQSSRPPSKTPNTGFDSTYRDPNQASVDQSSYGYPNSDYYSSDTYNSQQTPRSYQSTSMSKQTQPTMAPANPSTQLRQSSNQYEDTSSRGGRPSRFSSQVPDDSLGATGNSAAYPTHATQLPNNYQSYYSYDGMEGSAIQPSVAPKNVSGQNLSRERSRFDQGQSAPPAVSYTQSSRQPNIQSAPSSQQAYNYGYTQPNTKTDYSAYGTYGSYDYGYGNYASESQPSQLSATPLLSNTPSLYESAVVGSATSLQSDSKQIPDPSGSTYSSYYQYGSAPNAGAAVPMAVGQSATDVSAGYDASYYAAQQYSAWQYTQAPPTAAIGGGAQSSVAAPASAIPTTTQSYNYPYAGYGYGGATSGQTNSAAAGQYYTGY